MKKSTIVKTKTKGYVWIDTCYTVDHGWETMVFASDKNGNVSNWMDLDCDIYVTLEPCPMCSWAIKLSRIRNVYYCTSKSEDENDIINKIKLDNYEEYCTNLLREFFKDRR